MLDRIAAGRTDLVFEWTGQGGAFDAEVDGAHLMQWCAYYGDVSGLRHLMARGGRLERLGADLGLNAAAFHGHWRLCEFLLEHGADANHAEPGTEEVPLHAALCKHESLAHERVVAVLLKFGADPNRKTVPGAETGGFMRDARTRGETPLHRAASFGTAKAIQLLLDAGAQIDAKDCVGDSPLSWGSWSLRHDDILRLLCYGPYRIRPDRAGMAANLLGGPVAGATP
jgi:hypothetical protein